MLNKTKTILTTKRLFLREMSENDLEYLQKIFDEATAMTFYTPHQKQEKAKIWIEHMQASYKENRFGMWLCFLAKSKMFIGQCGIMKNEINGNDELELGYSILRKFWNRGYATEAAQACINYVFGNLDVPRVVSLIENDNLPSVHVSRKVGMKKTDQVNRWNKMTDLYSINKEDPRLYEV